MDYYYAEQYPNLGESLGDNWEAYVAEYDKYDNTVKPSWQRLYRSEAYQQFTAYMTTFWDQVAAGEISQEEAKIITARLQEAFAKYARN